MVIPASFLIDTARQEPLRELSKMIIQVQKPEEKILMIGFKKPTVTFYTQRNIEYLNNSDRALEYLESLPKKDRNILIIAREKDINIPILKPKKFITIAQNEPYKLIRLTR